MRNLLRRLEALERGAVRDGPCLACTLGDAVCDGRSCGLTLANLLMEMPPNARDIATA